MSDEKERAQEEPKTARKQERTDDATNMTERGAEGGDPSQKEAGDRIFVKK